MADESIWRPITEELKDSFTVELHVYSQFQTWRRVKRTWWRRLLWAPWRSHRLELPDA